jgi:hypothetical protein
VARVSISGVQARHGTAPRAAAPEKGSKEKLVKSFSISAYFPEVRPAHMAFQHCVAKGSEMGTAISRGLIELRDRPGVKGKRITEVRITVKEVAVATPES